MKKTLEITAKTEDEAIERGLRELNLDRDEVSVEVIERAKSGFLGLGASPAVVRLEYEAPDGKKERIKDFLDGLLGHMGTSANIEVTERDDGRLHVNLSGDDMGVIIGRRGETLDAIQHLTNYAVNRGEEKRVHISVDAENYRSKREDSLARLAEKMAAKAVKYKKSMALEPMNSYERHVIHTALQDYNGVSTSSIGTEPNRRVVVNYVGGGSPRPSRSTREWS